MKQLLYFFLMVFLFTGFVYSEKHYNKSDSESENMLKNSIETDHFNNANVAISNQNLNTADSLWVYDAANGEIIARIKVGKGPTYPIPRWTPALCYKYR